jgi:hypothetical protein
MSNKYKILLRASLDAVSAKAYLSTYTQRDKSEINRLVKQFNQADNKDNFELMEETLKLISNFGS